MNEKPDIRAVLWENVSALMFHRYGKENLTRLASDAKVGPGTSSRMKAKETYAQLDTLKKLAAAFDLEPWQLLVPGLDPTNPPVLRPVTAAEKRLYARFLAFRKALETDDGETANTDADAGI